MPTEHSDATPAPKLKRANKVMSPVLSLRIVSDSLRCPSVRGGFVLALLAFVLAGCASRPPSSTTPVGPIENPFAGGFYKVGAPYTVRGVRYVPKADWTYQAVGTASWYGATFHGKRTANGEIFDKTRLSAAHPTLPLPSLVEVTNLSNGRMIQVRVNDRGPFRHGRIIDLSEAAAEELGFRRQGHTRVRVRMLGPASIGADGAATGDNRVQLASLDGYNPAAPGEPIDWNRSGGSATPTLAALIQDRTGPSGRYAAPVQPEGPRVGSLNPQAYESPDRQRLTAYESAQGSDFETARGVAAQSNAGPPITSYDVIQSMAIAELTQLSGGNTGDVPNSGTPSSDTPSPAASSPERPSPSAPQPVRVAQVAPGPAPLFLQVGAYRSAESARMVADVLGASGQATLASFPTPSVSEAMVDGRPIYRVRVGPFATQASLAEVTTVLIGLGYEQPAVVRGL